MAGDSRSPGTADVRVVCVGETMVMFGPPPYETIEYCDHFVALLGGAEANVAIGLERLGIHAGWIGKMPRNALARKMVNQTRAFGVDTSAVIWTDSGRVGTFFVEWGAPPRPVMTIYDRAGSAASTLCADDLDWDYVGRAEWLEITGITPALSATCREAVPEIARRARQRGLRVALDANYRALLWSEEAAGRSFRTILPYVNLLVATESDMAIVLGQRLAREEALRRVSGEYGLDAAVMTLGGEGCLAYGQGTFCQAPAHQVQLVNRLGAGDAFFAGLLYGLLGSDLPTALRYGMAMSALKMTVPQNIPMVNRDAVERLVGGRSCGDLIR